MRKFFIAAALAVVSLLSSVRSAEAAYAIQIYDDGNLEFQGGTGVASIGTGFVIAGIPSANSLTFSATTTHFSISNGSGLSNNPGTQGASNLDLSSNEQITTTFGTSGGLHTIKIVLTQTDWQAPTGTPLTLSSSAGGSVGALSTGSATVSATYQGFLDNTNTAFGQPVAGSTPIQNASASAAGSTTTPLVFTPGTSGNNNVPGGTPFSITDVLEFTFDVTPSSGQVSANVSASTVASVPAPAGLVLALTGIPVLGIGSWLRRRQAV
jgi:hypothetical protein